MSDTGDSTPVEAAPVQSAPVESAPAAPVEAAPVETSALDSELPEGMRSFDRSYVEKLRAEAGGSRTKAKELEAALAERDARLERFAAFEGYPDEDLEVWSGLATDWKADPTVAAARFQEIALRVLGDPTSTPTERADAQAVLDNPVVTEALTPDKVREIAREETTAQEQARKQKEAVDGVFRQIKEAGYEEGTPQAFQILWYANNRTDGDIDAAIAAHKAEEQAVIDRYVESMAKGGTPVRLPSSGEAGSPSTEAPKTINDARRQADAWLKERAQA